MREALDEVLCEVKLQNAVSCDDDKTEETQGRSKLRVRSST